MSTQHTKTRTRMVALAGALVLATLPVAACGDDGDADVTVTTTEQPGVGEQGKGGAAQESLEGRLGQDVRFTGEVAELVSATAFTVGGDEVGENPILVVGASIPEGLAGGDQVRVQGTVEEFQVAGWEQDLDWDLVDDDFDSFDGDPAVRASSVSRV